MVLSSANEGKSGFIYSLVKEIISCLSVQTCAYFMKILANSQLCNLKAHITKSRMIFRLLKYLKASLTNSEDQDQTAHVGAV